MKLTVEVTSGDRIYIRMTFYDDSFRHSSNIKVEEFCLLEYNAEWSVENQPTSSACYLLHAGFLLVLFVDPEDGGDIFFRNVG
jgi:hypothetical protein